jgi:hypothetical protein
VLHREYNILDSNIINNVYQNVIYLARLFLNVQLKIELTIGGSELHPQDLMEWITFEHWYATFAVEFQSEGKSCVREFTYSERLTN